ncbi:MAG: universal stress protein [Acidobacteriota bacterium]
MIPQPKTLVIGTSLGPESEAVVASGLAFARALAADAEIVHAYTPIATLFATFEGPLVTPQLSEIERRQIVEAVEAQASRHAVLATDGAPSAAPKVRTHIAEGPAHRLLVERAAALDADLILIGSVEVGKHNWTFGSTADRVVRQAPCPVLVLRPDQPILPHRVLVPVDLSPTSRRAIEAGLALLAPLEGKPTFELLFALDPLDSAGLRQFRQDQLVRLAESELQRMALVLTSQSGAIVQRKVRVGGPVTEILAEVDERHPDLVVIGTHGYGGLERLLLGSVASKVIRSAPTNVLVVPPKAAQRAEEERFDAAAQKGQERGYISDQVHRTAA